MDDANLQKRKELANALLAELENTNVLLREAAGSIENESGSFYEEAFREKQEELQNEIEGYRRNTERVGELNKEITASVNSWFEFVKSDSETGKAVFPVIYFFRKRTLLKNIGKLNAEISDIMIKNRFIKERLTILEHQLEIKAMSLAKSGENYLDYEKLLQKRELLTAELKYLLPTVQNN